MMEKSTGDWINERTGLVWQGLGAGPCLEDWSEKVRAEVRGFSVMWHKEEIWEREESRKSLKGQKLFLPVSPQTGRYSSC